MVATNAPVTLAVAVALGVATLACAILVIAPEEREGEAASVACPDDVRADRRDLAAQRAAANAPACNGAR
jgi:hypothetical protein